VRRGNNDYRPPLPSVTDDGLEYNLKTCIPERLANPWNGRRSTAPTFLGLNKTSGQVSNKTLIESPANFDDIGYASATCPRSEVRATVEAP
jgi:hypothetical protein